MTTLVESLRALEAAIPYDLAQELAAQRDSALSRLGKAQRESAAFKVEVQSLRSELELLRERRPRAVERAWAWGHGKGLTDVPPDLGVDVRQILRINWQPFDGTPEEEGRYNADRALATFAKYPAHLQIQPVVVMPANFGLQRVNTNEHPLVLEDFDTGDWKQALRERYLAAGGPFLARLNENGVWIERVALDELYSRWMIDTPEELAIRDRLINDIAASFAAAGLGPIDFSQYGIGGIGTWISISAYDLAQAQSQCALYWPQVMSGKYGAMIPWLLTPGTPGATDGYFRAVLRFFLRATGGHVRRYYFWNRENKPGTEEAWRRFAEIEREVTAEMWSHIKVE